MANKKNLDELTENYQKEKEQDSSKQKGKRRDVFQRVTTENELTQSGRPKKKTGPAPKLNKPITRNFHIEEEMWEELGELSRQLKVNRSDLIREAIEEKLERMKK